MASRIPEIKDVYNTLMEGVSVGSTTFAEVRELPFPYNFPASTLMLSEVTQGDFETGGGTSNDWVFIQTVYVDFSNEDADAIEELELLIEAVQSAVRHASPDDLTLPDGRGVEFTIDGSTAPADGTLPAGRVAFKEFSVTARTEEI